MCLLHFNEIQLKHIFIDLDGATVGPKLFSGSIGRQLIACEKSQIQIFQKVFTDDLPVLPKDVLKDLSEDQKYLYSICQGIQKGSIDSGLAMKSPGTLVHSRFLTTANRVLRLYVSKSAPSTKLKSLVNFIVKVYAPMWFKIKSKDSFIMGPRHIFNYVKLVREHVDESFQQSIFNSIKRNAYFAHPENILLSMLYDTDKNVRKMSAEVILETRKSNESALQIRKFVRPTLDINCRVYYELTELKNFEPPFTKKLLDFEIEALIENVNINGLDKIPCHTQAVERNIQLVSKVSKQVSGESSRSQRVLATIQARELLPKMNSKQDYIDFVEN